jgi:hypothetical protein
MRNTCDAAISHVVRKSDGLPAASPHLCVLQRWRSAVDIAPDAIERLKVERPDWQEGRNWKGYCYLPRALPRLASRNHPAALPDAPSPAFEPRSQGAWAAGQHTAVPRQLAEADGVLASTSPDPPGARSPRLGATASAAACSAPRWPTGLANFIGRPGLEEEALRLVPVVLSSFGVYVSDGHLGSVPVLADCTDPCQI